MIKPPKGKGTDTMKAEIYNPYTDNGYKDRNDYLNCLADEMGIDPAMVHAGADMLGPNEDFDGLVTTLEDYCY